MKLLIDECLSPSLAAIARARGIAADAVAHFGKEGWQDHSLASFALDNDYTIVTNNRRDFLRLYATLEVHAGLIIIVPRASRERTRQLFAIALDRLEALADVPINKVLEVLESGDVRFYDWSRDQG